MVNIRKFLIYPERVKANDIFTHQRFWGMLEQSSNGEELKLSFRPTYASRSINNEIEEKLIDFFESNGFVVNPAHRNHQSTGKTLFKNFLRIDYSDGKL